MAPELKKQRLVDSEDSLCCNQSDCNHVSKIDEGSTSSKVVRNVSTPESNLGNERSSSKPQKRSSSQSLIMTDSSVDRDQYSHIPHDINNWERKHIEKLNIKVSFRPDISPLQLISRKIQKTGLTKSEVQRIESNEEEKKIASLLNYVQQSKFIEMMGRISYTEFNDLCMNSLMGLDMYADDRYQCSFIPDGLPENLKLWFYRFHTHGKMVAYILHKMVENKEKGVENNKCHFQHLFDTFSKMFGLTSIVSFAPCLQKQKMSIMDTEVCAAPDIVYSRHCLKSPTDKELENSPIVAICEVRNESPLKKDNQITASSSKTKEKSRKQISTEEVSSSSASCSIDREFPHISDRLIGHHGGDLLSFYQHSNRCDLIIGLVIQETHVTFTALEMTDSQYQRIKDGSIKNSEEDRPVFTFTKAYDYLKEEDLVNIIEPLIRLGLEQEK